LSNKSPEKPAGKRVVIVENEDEELK